MAVLRNPGGTRSSTVSDLHGCLLVVARHATNTGLTHLRGLCTSLPSSLSEARLLVTHVAQLFLVGAIRRCSERIYLRT